MLKTPHHAWISEEAKFGKEMSIVQAMRAEIRRRKAAKEEMARLVSIFAVTFTATLFVFAGLMALGVI